jgi:hypothetical protein
VRRVGTQVERRVGAEPGCNVRRSLSPTRLIRLLCSECETYQGIYVPAEGFLNWKLGFGTVQELMPELTPNERAVLWSGRCLRCVRLMYENMETEGDEGDEGDEDPRTVTDIRDKAGSPTFTDRLAGAVTVPNCSLLPADGRLPTDGGRLGRTGADGWPMSGSGKFLPVEPWRFREVRSKHVESGRARQFAEATHRNHDGVRLPRPTTMGVIDDYLRRTAIENDRPADRGKWELGQGQPPKVRLADELRLRVQLVKIRYKTRSRKGFR